VKIFLDEGFIHYGHVRGGAIVAIGKRAALQQLGSAGCEITGAYANPGGQIHVRARRRRRGLAGDVQLLPPVVTVHGAPKGPRNLRDARDTDG